ncbi:long-chain fatty acid--CoA ligase [Hydrogenophaga sp. 2FB]|uniref:long-chain fatty acid--CoA ligase n=1 Tax=Hydrogenophaga sp. 2FB TaxID=2502187 RepID=UPI0010F8B899|nr:long-chain fatty acid--CoA ligase [Hydrogenophaga sp. 2FB]
MKEKKGALKAPSSPLRLDAKHARLGLSSQVHIPETSLADSLEVSARRFPSKTAVQFFGTAITYADLLRDVERMAGHLQRVCGVRRGDRVAVFSQNCPQFIVAYLAILRADAVFVPVNAMLLHDELDHIVQDSGCVAAFVAQELVAAIAPLLGHGPLRHLVVHAYGDLLGADDAGLDIPDWVRQPSGVAELPAGASRWSAALLVNHTPAPREAGPDDLCMLPYTSGTTGAPKACMHTHRTVLTSVVGNTVWRRVNAESVFLCVAPLFHLLGLQHNVNAAIYAGGTTVLMPRWDRENAATLIERHRVTYWAALPAMLVDFFALPGIEDRDLSSLSLVTGGGAATPERINQLLKTRYGLDYVEGYGLTETAAFLCANPVHAPKRVCLGVPTFGVDLRLLDPETLQPVAPGEVGEIVAHGAQVMLGYWNNPQANHESFLVIDGKRFLRTGDLASMDEDGYVFMRDRLKRMINASGYKVWPAEVEAVLNGHPAIHEACVIASPDERRGETVKAVIALKPGATASAQDILAWCRETMAAYKAPRLVDIVDSLPKSSTGKLAWRELQEQELARVAQPDTGGAAAAGGA